MQSSPNTLSIVGHYFTAIFARPVNLLIMEYATSPPDVTQPLKYYKSNSSSKSGTLLYFPMNAAGDGTSNERIDCNYLANLNNCKDILYCGYQTHNTKGQLNLSIDDIVDDYTAQIVTRIGDSPDVVPLHFYGHSIGGIIATEVARRVKEQRPGCAIASVTAYNTGKSISAMIASFIGRIQLTHTVSFPPIYIPESLLRHATGHLDLTQSARVLADKNVHVNTINLEKDERFYQNSSYSDVIPFGDIRPENVPNGLQKALICACYCVTSVASAIIAGAVVSQSLASRLNPIRRVDSNGSKFAGFICCMIGIAIAPVCIAASYFICLGSAVNKTISYTQTNTSDSTTPDTHLHTKIFSQNFIGMQQMNTHTTSIDRAIPNNNAIDDFLKQVYDTSLQNPVVSTDNIDLNGCGPALYKSNESSVDRGISCKSFKSPVPKAVETHTKDIKSARKLSK